MATTTKTARKVRTNRQAVQVQGWDRFAKTWRNLVAVAMPVFALCLAKIAATLVTEQPLLAVFAGVLGACGLAVSLKDCKQSIKVIAGVGDWCAWSLAILFDMMVVMGELVMCFAPTAGLDLWAGGLMVTGGVFSMGFNAFAFNENTRQ